MGASTTFTNSTTRTNAVNEALTTIRQSNLPESVKQVALKNLNDGTFTTYTVATGNSKTQLFLAVLIKFVNNNSGAYECLILNVLKKFFMSLI